MNIDFVYRLYTDIQLTSSFLSEFNVSLEALKKINLIILGDINIDLLNKSNLISDSSCVMTSNGLKSFVNELTRIQGNLSTCIDHTFFKIKY